VSLDTRARTLDRAIRLRRQQEGEALDLNAAVESRISWRAGVTPDPRIFQRPGKRRRHAAILLLLDLSESTNDRVTGFTSVLDVEKQAADLLAQSIDLDYDRLAIDGFCSDGRANVHYLRLKDFDEPYDDVRRQRLKRQQGELSTRMGAALRHAGARLAAQVAEKRILLLVTDGEPSDIDVADADYLVEDARHAAQALQAKGVTVFCLTLDKAAGGYVKKIFGARNFLIVDNAMTLPTQLARALTRIAAS
jgi:nitric oxide reductase activation protein